MKVIAPPHRKDAFPAWPFVGFSLAFLGGVGALARLLPERWLPPCGFHLAFGHPCPSCGTTRLGLSLLQGHPVEAFRYHPFFFAVLSGLALWFAAGLCLRLAGRDLFLVTTAREDRWGWFFALAAFLLNWAYLWHADI